ncbi:MAG: zinc ribbon domain-containing protein [Methanobacteriota archaeon]|nr:MAG: zinc ribbon domain-containing protein [Euryarchaeota archaeon]
MVDAKLAAMALTTEEKMILIAVLVAVMALVLYFEMRVMRGRAKEVRRASFRRDEAFNAVLTTRSIMDIVKREGGDVGPARVIVDRARDAMSRGEHRRAIELCDSARAELMKCRRETPAAPAAETDSVPFDIDDLARDILPPRPEPRERAGDQYQGTKLPFEEGSGYMSAKFEISTAKDELADAKASGSEVSEAERMLSDADGEFEAGRYSKALSAAVRARRHLNDAVAAEAIPLTPSPVREESPSGSDRECPSCRSMVLPDDEFCSQCGAPTRRKCPHCGREPGEGDRFCRKCGNAL